MRKAEVILTIGVFIVGILVGKCFNWAYFVISKEINFAEIFSTGISFVLAYVVVKILEKGKEERRIEKDFLISKIEAFSKDSNDLLQIIRTGKIDYTTAVSSFKILNMKAKKIFKIAGKINVVVEEQEKQKIFKSLKKIKDLTTYTPRTAPQKVVIEIIDNVINLSSERISEIEIEYDRLEDYWFDIQMKTNKS